LTNNNRSEISLDTGYQMIWSSENEDG